MRFGVAAALLFLLAGCSGVSYPDEEVIESIDKILLTEYSMDDALSARDGKSLWLHIPVERIYNKNSEMDEKTMRKVQNASLAATRVFLSSDADIDFICIYARDRDGLELRMIRHTKDIEKARVWYISGDDLDQRSEISLDYNPQIYGKKVIRRLEGASSEKIAENIISEKRPELAGKIPRFKSIREIKSFRISDSRALIYTETEPGGNRSLFLVDTGFDNMLKDLILLLQSAGESGGSEELLDGATLPVIADYWDLSNEMPREYRYLGVPAEWPENEVYSRPVVFEYFISRQLERKIRNKFENKADLWDTEIQGLDVSYTGDIIRITRRAVTGDNALQEVNPDHEIILTVSDTLKDYDFELDKLVLRDSEWDTGREIDKEKLVSIKAKKWPAIKKTEKVSLAERITSLLIPGYIAENAE